MTLQQKVAWFNLSVCILAMLTYAILLPILGPWRASGSFGILGLTGISGFLYIIEKKKGRIFADERDTTISRRAYMIAQTVAFTTLIVAFVVTSQLIGDDGAIMMRSLGTAVWFAICGYIAIYSLATLVLYAKQ